MTLTRCGALLAFASALSSLSFSQGVPANTGSKVTKEQAQAALQFQNQARKEVGAPPLEWSADLAKYAQDWADHLAGGRSCALTHRPADGRWKRLYGENSFIGSDPATAPLQASKGWYSEIKNYKPGLFGPDNLAVSGHYTQMVWRTTLRVGIGVAQCKQGLVVIIANYDPPGNMLGETAY